ncbi:MAG: TrbG/VirB9 family P-type conjugative transfer protein [Sulfurimonas sp.]|jgi:type IV secretion system protein VirB9|uniref:TrbG/VirB9 family P-type conjugative transfer protein n=1 Tax=Sulfurimonas sp. TaxID=2022749 RepID=UPI0035684892
MKKILICGLVISNFLFALSTPRPSPYDNRMTFATYNANDVTKVYTRTGYTTAIKFEENEKIVNIASGFTDGYYFINRSNILFVSPKPYVSNISTNSKGETVSNTVALEPTPADWKTNLIVITNKRDYVFDLMLAKNNVHYKISFHYPDTQKANRNKSLIEKELRKTSVPRNWEFYMNVNPGSDDITPDFAYDDGKFTYLGFASTKTIPSVFQYQNKKESILNTHIKKDGNYDVLVVHKMTRMIILRSGKKIVGIINSGYGKNPLHKTHQTSSKKIKRGVKNAKR